jgi:hypothetical protein
MNYIVSSTTKFSDGTEEVTMYDIPTEPVETVENVEAPVETVEAPVEEATESVEEVEVEATI